MVNEYEQFGSNYRIPKAVQDDGGAGYNSGNLDDPANREGRPRTAQPEDGQPAEDTRKTTDQPQSPGQLAGQPAPTTAPAQPQQTFQQLQAAGVARPPAPTQNPQTGMWSTSGSPSQYATQGQATGETKSGAYGAPNMTLLSGPPPAPNDIGGMTAPQPQQLSQSNPNTPAAMPADGGIEGKLKGAWEGYTPQQFPGANPDMRAQIEAMLKQTMANPSRYDTGVAKDSFNMLSQNIDDDYNARDQGLRESIASRGLGSVGDSSIGTGDQRFQNLQRRTAKQDMASGILREQANTYGADRSSAIRDAMGYGNDQFGNALQGAQFNANQKQQAYNNLDNYGKTAFDNQMRTNDAKRQQDLDQQNLLMKMLGLG